MKRSDRMNALMKSIKKAGEGHTMEYYARKYSFEGEISYRTVLEYMRVLDAGGKLIIQKNRYPGYANVTLPKKKTNVKK